jgi:hypothetical protein
MSKSQDKRFKHLAPEVLDEAVAEIAELAADQGLAVALVGGYALQHYGSPRLTGDVDFCIEGNLTGLKRVGSLSFGGKQVAASNGVTVDLIERDDSYAELYADALSKAKRMRGVQAPIVSIDHILAMKLEAQRPKDLADLAFIINSGLLDLKKARRIVRDFVGGDYAVRDLDNMIKHADYIDLEPDLNKNRMR